MHRTRVLSDTCSMPVDFEHLSRPFKQNGYTDRDIAWIIKQPDAKVRACDSEEPRAPMLVIAAQCSVGLAECCGGLVLRPSA